MRKFPAVFAAALAVAVIAHTDNGHAQNDPALKVTLAGGSVGGAWSAIGNAIGEGIRRQAPGTAFSYEPGRDAANVQLVSTGRAQLGIAHAQIALRAIAGQPPFAEKFANVRAVSLIDSEAAWQAVTPANSKVESLEQIKQNRIPVRVTANLRGTLMAVATEEAFKAAGAPFADIERWGGKVHYVAYNDALDMLKAGQVDIVTNVLDFPSRQLVTASRESPVRFVKFGTDVVDKVGKSLGTEPVQIKANTYGFQPEAVDTFRAHVVLLTAADAPDAQVTTIVRAIINNFDYLKTAHATMARLDRKALPNTGGVPLHPAAEKVYREAGLLR
jgi:TRAP transporter TAXI family solute receptor